MPIYAYRCAACGHAKDVLQKMSDAALTTCPSCGAGEFRKQLTAAGFQLKGSGWYVTDFKGGAAAKTADKPADAPAAGAAPAAGDASSPGEAAKPAAPASTSAAGDGGSSAAGGCGSSCACH
jgi:putative FmdB family regulatory protein